MLNLLVMQFLGWLATILLSGWFLIQPPIQAANPPIILTPLEGEALRGVVMIMGDLPADQYRSFEVFFTYMNDTTSTWFLVGQGTQAGESGLLASWDTTTITDGDYQILLRAVAVDGTTKEALVKDLRVRNYTPIETLSGVVNQTSLAPLPTITMQPAATETRQTVTPLPPNPAVIRQSDLAYWIIQGIAFTFLVFVFIGVYRILRQITHRH